MLITCKECGHKVSDKADKCPSCGIKRAVKKSSTGSAVLSLAMLVGVIYFTAPSRDDGRNKERETAQKSEVIAPSKPASVTPNPAPKEPVKPSCATDWKLCKTTSDLINENKEMAIQIQVACKMASEEKHTQSIDWGGFFSPNFSSYIPEDFSGDKKEVTVIDDVAMYENIYGAKVKTKTLCVYNLNTMKAATVLTTQM